MDKYEYRVKTEQMLEYAEEKQYKKAMEIADTIDWRRVKNPSMLNTVSEIYEYNGEFQKSRDILFVAYDRAPESRKIIYRLGLLALKINDTDEASDCYEEFVKVAPKDPNQYILKYKILKAQNAPYAEQISALEDFKKAEYVEKWAYELASLYHQAGMTAKCLEECDDLILWFSEGKYVYQAMELKMKYKPLTPLQQEKYDSRPGARPKVNTLAAVKAKAAQAKAAEQVKEENTVKEENIRKEEPQEAVREEQVEEKPEEAVAEEAEEREKPAESEKSSAITKVVAGATLEEALTNLASGIKIEEEAMAQKEEELLLGGQMKIDEILQEWEEKQKVHADAIEEQKKKDEERIRKEREAAEKRREAERLEIERKAAEAEAARKAAEEEAARKAAEEEAARKAAEEEAARKAAEEEAARKAAEEAERKAELEAIVQMAEKDRDPGLEGKTQRLPDDILELVEQLESRVAGTEAAKEMEEELTEEDEMEEEIFGGAEDDFVGGEETELPEIDEEYLQAEFENEAAYDDVEYAEEDDFDEEEYEEIEAEEDFEEADFEEEDFEEEDFEEDEEDFDLDSFFAEEESVKAADFEIEEPSEAEIQKRIKKSKGSGVPFDTGFVVTGRYDLSATSEIGLKAGLTEEQKKLFSYFVPVRGMSEQIVEVLDNDRRAQREGTSKTGNLLVIGRKGSGKTVLAVDIVKAIQKQRNLKQGKVAIVTGESLNKKELSNIIQKLRGGAIIIEKAGKLNARTVKELSYLMEKKTGEMLFVLEDQRKPLERILTANPDFKRKFTSKLELPVFINDELVTFGQTYAKENGYKLDEMGILALYSRIDVMQREDHAVTVAEVKEIMDEAIAHSQKANVKHLARRVFGKSTDDSDRVILKEEDFKI